MKSGSDIEMDINYKIPYKILKIDVNYTLMSISVRVKRSQHEFKEMIARNP